MLKMFLLLAIMCSFIALPVFSQENKPQGASPEVSKEAQKVTEPNVEQPKLEPPKEETVKGVIREIAADGSYILVDTTKILTTKELLEDSYLEIGDKVEVIVEKTDTGLKAKSCNYIFEEEETEPAPAEGASGAQNMPKY